MLLKLMSQIRGLRGEQSHKPYAAWNRAAAAGRTRRDMDRQNWRRRVMTSIPILLRLLI